MHYHFAILLLFWPVTELKIVGTELSPKDICVQAADAIGTLVQSYARLCTLQRTPSLVPYFMLTAAVVHLATITDSRQTNSTMSGSERYEFAKTTDKPAVDARLNEDVTFLKEMTHCHPLAGKALRILSYLTENGRSGQRSRLARYLYKIVLRYAGHTIEVFNTVLRLA